VSIWCLFPKRPKEIGGNWIDYRESRTILVRIPASQPFPTSYRDRFSHPPAPEPFKISRALMSSDQILHSVRLPEEPSELDLTALR